jgi:uncharacterized protein (DUF433 family)
MFEKPISYGKMKKAARVEVNPEILCGKPVIKGTRIAVHQILDLIEDGQNFDQIMEEYPQLKKEDIKAAIDYASQILKHQEGRGYGA